MAPQDTGRVAGFQFSDVQRRELAEIVGEAAFQSAEADLTWAVEVFRSVRARKVRLESAPVAPLVASVRKQLRVLSATLADNSAAWAEMGVGDEVASLLSASAELAGRLKERAVPSKLRPTGKGRPMDLGAYFFAMMVARALNTNGIPLARTRDSRFGQALAFMFRIAEPERWGDVVERYQRFVVETLSLFNGQWPEPPPQNPS